MKNKEKLTCKICGFITYSDKDIAEHLSDYRKKGRTKFENCNIKIIERSKNEK